MPRIQCAYEGCVYLEGNFCSATKIVLDPDEGCLTFAEIGDLALDDEDLELDDEDWEDDLLVEEDEADYFEEEEEEDGYDPDEWN